MSYVVYAIIDPRDCSIFYIGETGNFSRRCEQHLEGNDQLSGLLIQHIKQSGQIPQFAILEQCSSEEAALMAEMFWIETMKARGAKLSNSQAFNGYADRQHEKQARTKALEGMTKPKYKKDRLRHLANGRTYQMGMRPKQKKHVSWTKRDDVRLAGMVKKNMPIEVMSKFLGHSETVIKAHLADQHSGKRSWQN